MGRVLVTEKLAQPGLDLMADAGHEVDVQLGLTPEQLAEAIVGANALVIRSATTVTAEVLAAVSGDLSAVALMRAAFDRRRLTMHRMLNEIDGVECLLPEGAFYAFPSVTGLYGRELRGRIPASSAELAELAIEDAKVAVVPGEAFGSPGYFRLSYALGDDDLVEGVSRLAGLFTGG